MTITDSPINSWRRVTPGAEGWRRTIRPDDPDKYFIVSADCHAQEPTSYLAEHIEPEFRDRIPRVERRDDGSEWMITEGNRPQLVKRAPSRGDRAGAAVVRTAGARPAHAGPRWSPRTCCATRAA